MAELEQKANELGAKIIPKDDWDDCLPALLEEDGIDYFWDGDVLVIENRAEIAYMELYGKVWQTCYEWIPLWRLHNWSDCMSDFLKGDDKFFAIPATDSRDGDEDKGRAELEDAGFKTDTFEGF